MWRQKRKRMIVAQVSLRESGDAIILQGVCLVCVTVHECIVLKSNLFTSYWLIFVVVDQSVDCTVSSTCYETLSEGIDQEKEHFVSERKLLEQKIEQLTEQLGQCGDNMNDLSDGEVVIVRQTSTHAQTDCNMTSDRMTLDILGTEWLQEKEILTCTIDELTAQLRERSSMLSSLSDRRREKCSDVDIQTDFTHFLIDQSQQTFTADLIVCQTEYESFGTGCNDSFNHSTHWLVR